MGIKGRGARSSRYLTVGERDDDIEEELERETFDDRSISLVETRERCTDIKGRVERWHDIRPSDGDVKCRSREQHTQCTLPHFQLPVRENPFRLFAQYLSRSREREREMMISRGERDDDIKGRERDDDITGRER